MSTLLQGPVLIYLLVGLGAAYCAVAIVIDAVRTFRATESQKGETRKLGPLIRIAASLAFSGALALVGLYLLLSIVGMAPSLLRLGALKGAPAPEIAFVSLDDAVASGSLAELLDRVVLLNVWATWCGPCRTEMPDLARIQDSYGDRGLTVLHLSQEPLEILQGWLANHPTPSRHGKVDSLPFPVPALPTTLVIDRQGTVRDVLVGASDFDDFRDAVEPWL